MQLPDAIRPYAILLAKYHFWLLAAVVPLILLPLLLLSKGRMLDDIVKARSQIGSRLTSLRNVNALQPHPNEAWATEIKKTTDGIKRETLQEWKFFWESQKPLRIWPATLGPDFLQRTATGLKADSKLPRKLLERYQDSVRTLVQDLPARMGADGAMLEANPTAPGQSPPADTGVNRGGPGAILQEGSQSLVQWNAEDQKKLYASFNWAKPPTTAQVALAQEELWVYGLLCDAIKRVNTTATGAYNAPIPRVEQLMIGYPAAEDSPGGMGRSRIFRPAFQGSAPPSPEGGAMPPADQPAVRPPHPRFGGQGTSSGPMPPSSGNPSGLPEDGGTVASPDDALRNWIYVDFDGKPLSAAELSSSPASLMVHLMPFVIRAVVDQRKLDSLLVELAASAVPVDVRQVRVNVGEGLATTTISSPASTADGTGRGSRNNDVVVELRGTVGLATPPDEKAFGLAPETPTEPEPQPEPQPPGRPPE
ncbi:MAG: hypothetical protein WCQ91_00805 [Planctomycetota bacterium]